MKDYWYHNFISRANDSLRNIDKNVVAGQLKGLGCVFIINNLSGHQDSVTEWIMRWPLKQTILGSSSGVNIKSRMQVRPAEESQIRRNAHPGIQY